MPPLPYGKRIFAPLRLSLPSVAKVSGQDCPFPLGGCAALRAAAKLVPEGATLETFELDGIPVFNQNQDQTPPPKVAELKRRIREADAVLFVTPEYNYSAERFEGSALEMEHFRQDNGKTDTVS